MTEVQQRAAQAKRELSLTEGAFARMRAGAIEKMCKADLASVEGDRVRARMASIVQVIDGVRQVLQGTIDGAIIEDANEEIRKLMEIGQDE